MTAERFEVVLNEFDEVEYIMDKTMMEDRDFAEFMDFVETVCKENEQLKTTIQQLRTDNTKQKKKLNTTMKENEQLKQRINVLDDQITAQGIVIEGYQNRNQKLFDEKEHIKHTIKTMMENERTELGKMTLRQLWRQIQ